MMQTELPKPADLEERVFLDHNEEEFLSIALEVFQFQFFNNSFYQKYCRAIHKTPENVSTLDEIPFLPVSFFKSHEIKTTEFEAEKIFQSSGTTGSLNSRHFVKKVELYEKSFTLCFEKFYGPVKDYCILGLLPSYLEREGSSLVYMVESLIRKSGHSMSGFYLHDHDRLHKNLRELETAGQKTILFGVTYALLDFAENWPMQLNHVTLIETGGMKGRKKEITREEMYQDLRSAFLCEEIHSEYGMTELLSQAYGKNGLFHTVPWMKVLVRDETDPFQVIEKNGRGVINIIDLANLYSCSFIATDDIGRIHSDGSFEVLGRMDNSDLRGCSLMLSQMENGEWRLEN